MSDAAIADLFEAAAATGWFGAKLRIREACRDGGAALSEDVRIRLRSVTFKNSGRILDFAGLARRRDDDELELVCRPGFARVPILGRSALQHELLHLCQQLEWGALTLERGSRLTLRDKIAAEIDALLWGCPLILVALPSIVVEAVLFFGRCRLA